MNKFRRDYETQVAEREGAEALQWRREESEWMDEDLQTAQSTKNYYELVLNITNEKLAFFELLYKSYDEDEYGWDMMERLDP